MKFISLFAGVGGFDEGMRRAGHECVAMVEWDRAAAGVLSYRYPDVPLYCDVSKVKVDDLPDCDFLTYGFPCQDLSVAGKRKGLEGERSGLFFEATRLIRGLHARGSGFRFAVAENVKGLFSADDGHAFARCIRELQQCGASEIGWSVYDSQYFGLAQRRKRVFIVSDFGGSSCDQVLAVTESLHGNTAPEREAWKGAPAGVGSGFTASSYGGYERGCGTLRSEGGDIGGGSETLAVAQGAFSDGTQTSSSLTTRCHDQFMPDKGNFCAVIQAQGADVYNGEVTGDTAATVTTATGIANASGPKVVGWNGDTTPKSSEDLSVTLRSQQGGEGVGVAHGFYPTAGQDFPNLNELSPAMKAADPVGVAQMNPTVYQEDGKTVEGMCEMRGATMVRRLTPMECERLQGFPDGWTSNRCILELEGNQWKPTGKVEEQKDGPRYRQMGNAVSVPVAEYLGHRMAQAV
jgi:DNA (cytosine-5)-methyltransferase 1